MGRIVAVKHLMIRYGRFAVSTVCFYSLESNFGVTPTSEKPCRERRQQHRSLVGCGGRGGGTYFMHSRSLKTILYSSY